jgi:hypothetical protein
MDRFRILSGILAITVACASGGCRGHQFGHVIKDNQSDLVGSHSAGAATFNPLINEAVARLLARQETRFQPASFDGGPPLAKRVCFIGVENHGIEELGDFKEQIYEQIDSQILAAPHFEPINRRYVQAGLFESRQRPDSLFIPKNMQLFTAAMEREGHPFDYMMFAKLTSGTTESNHDYQRDYVLTLEVVDVQTGAYDKESAKVRKGYHKSRLGKLRNYNPFTRQ